jgi:hypothetical protein
MKSSINFQPVKNTSQSHNLRLREFDYVRKDLKETNYSVGGNRKHSEITKELKAIVKENTGRTAQAKAVFIKEGVFLIKPEHTNEQLHNVAKEFQKKFNVKVLELHVHRDEGHWEDNEKKIGWKPNLHAHIVIENINRETGKSIGWQRNEMILLQDFFAFQLEMERGKPSTKKHIDSKTWKVQKIEDEITAKNSVLNELSQKGNQMVDEIEDYINESVKNASTAYNLLLGEILSELARKTNTQEQLNEFVNKHPRVAELKKMYVINQTMPKIKEKAQEIIQKIVQPEKEEIKNKSKGMRR